MKKRVLILLAVVVSLAALFGFAFSFVTRLALFDIFFSLTPSATIFRESNILVLGVDEVFGARSDTIMVVHINPEDKSAAVVSIPRDTIVALPGRGLDKINHAFAYGREELTRQTVENFLRVSIPYYVTINLSGIEKLIDDLGGIMINVEKRMYYVDFAGNLDIDLQPGLQKLNGKQAMGYLRFRHSDGDFARIGRQQEFLQTVAAQLLKRENLLKSPSLFLSLIKCVETNLNSREILGLALALRGATELNQIKMTTVPGSDLMIDGIYYLRPNEVEVQKIVTRFLTNRQLASSGQEKGN